MSDKMIPIPFERMLKGLLKEYREKQCLMDVPVTRHLSNDYMSAVGPAAGPHTQLAGNIIAAYAAGASYFELKTVQVLTGDELGIRKPCIYAATEVFNTEWSTELSIEEAVSEYIKAYLLLKVLIKELKLGNSNHFEFVMSVGYDLKGIQTSVIDAFINHMKDARTAQAWQENISFLHENITCFSHISHDYLDSLSPVVSDTIALSTMHGCHKDEIEQIASYLLKDKHLNVYVKLNPTLLGKEEVRNLLDTFGYAHIVFDEAMFKMDIDFESACDMIKRLQDVGVQSKQLFGVKLTNTFPVRAIRGELVGETMYLSGPALYPIAIEVARRLSAYFKGKLPISFSGGAEPKNVRQILETGIRPVTVSSYLLKPAGYKNLTKLVHQADLAKIPSEINQSKLAALGDQALKSEVYHYRPKVVLPKSESYSPLCAVCNNCVDICPNRANRFDQVDGKKVVVHLDDLCNACGACLHYCIKGSSPYQEKLTLFSSMTALEESNRPGIYWDGTCHIKNIEPGMDKIIKKIDWEAYRA